MTTTDDRPAWKLTWPRKPYVVAPGEEMVLNPDPWTWTADDLTGEHVALLAIIHQDESWAPLDRSPLDGPIDLMAYLSAFIAIAERRDCLEVRIELAGTPIVKLMDALGAITQPAVD